MPKMSAGKRTELEAFWRAHLEGWRCSDLNQREYCELHSLPLKRFGNWRAKLRHEEPAGPRKLLWRRGGGLSHMSGHMTKEAKAAARYVPSVRSAPPGGRRRFSAADKKRIVEEACRPDASVSGVAGKFGIAVRLLFRWKKELAQEMTTTFLPVTLTDAPAPSAGPPTACAPGIGLANKGGRRVRFDWDADPKTAPHLPDLSEGAAP